MKKERKGELEGRGDPDEEGSAPRVHTTSPSQFVFTSSLLRTLLRHQENAYALST
jgi:hypothetical protein